MKTLLSFVSSLVALSIAIYVLNLDEIVSNIFMLSPAGLVVAFFAATLTHVAVAGRWYYLVRETTPSVPLLKHLQITLWGVFLNSFIPSNIGGDVYRFYALKEKASTKVALLGCLIRDRLVGLAGQFILYLSAFSIWYFFNNTHPRFFDLSAMVFTLGLAAFFLYPLAQRPISFVFNKLKLSQFNNYFELVSKHGLTGLSKPESLKCWTLTIIAQLLWVLVIAIVWSELAIDIDWLFLMMGVVVVELARMVPLTAQGLGVREAVWSWLFSLVGRSPEEGFVIATVAYLILSLSQVAVGGLVGLKKRIP